MYKFPKLFIPVSDKYPVFDFLIWDSKLMIIYGFQVTVQNPFTGHKSINGPDSINLKNTFK